MSLRCFAPFDTIPGQAKQFQATLAGWNKKYERLLARNRFTVRAGWVFRRGKRGQCHLESYERLPFVRFVGRAYLPDRSGSSRMS
ncbi:MAG: hypothetical protein LBD06_09115, partial [Candidatus Accumulibacter sp.]|nr:hypothetical protein [Accumulibacter sp.]